jgi:hypothetical protein
MQQSQVEIDNKTDNTQGSQTGRGYTVAKYRDSRFWGVWDESGELVCVCVYRRGAREVVKRLQLSKAGAYMGHQ